MRRVAVAVVLSVVALAVAAHAALAAHIAGEGAEAVGVALGPGTPIEQLALMAGFVAVRVGLFLLAPGAIAALIVAVWPWTR